MKKRKGGKKYGKVVKNVDFTALVEELEKTPCTAEVVYEPSVPELEALPVYKELQDVTYGEMPIQIGFCNGNNYKLNALEYHRTSEIDVAASELMLRRTIPMTPPRWKPFCFPRELRLNCTQQPCIMHPATAEKAVSAVQSFFRTDPIFRLMRTTSPPETMH